jgi:integrase/recombinase XerD
MLEELERRNYSLEPQSLLVCGQAVCQTLSSAPDRLGAEHIREYQLYLFRERKLAAKTVAQRVGALRSQPQAHRNAAPPAPKRPHLDATTDPA